MVDCSERVRAGGCVVGNIRIHQNTSGFVPAYELRVGKAKLRANVHESAANHCSPQPTTAY